MSTSHSIPYRLRNKIRTLPPFLVSENLVLGRRISVRWTCVGPALDLRA